MPKTVPPPTVSVRRVAETTAAKLNATASDMHETNVYISGEQEITIVDCGHVAVYGSTIGL
jgi:hypothetical protein